MHHAAAILALLLPLTAAASEVTLGWDYNPPGQWVTNYYIAASDYGPVPQSPTEWPIFKPVGNTNRAELWMPPGFIPEYYGCWAENAHGMSEPATISAVDPAGPVGSLRIIELREAGIREFGFTNLPPVGDIDYSYDLETWHNFANYWLRSTQSLKSISWRIDVGQAPQLFWRLREDGIGTGGVNE